MTTPTPATWIGPFGRLVAVRVPAPGLPVTVSRPSSETVLLSGAARAQRASESSRRWRWTIPWGSDDDVFALIALEQGAFGTPPWWWYDPMATRTNMLAPEWAVPGMGVDLDDAGPMPAGGWPFAYSTAGPVVTTPVPVIAGRTYTGSAYIDGSGTVSLVWVDAAREPLSQDDSAGSGRVAASGNAPASAAGVELHVDGTRVTGMQLIEGATLTTWRAGQGIPRVTIAGMEQLYQRATVGDQRRDIALELIEVS